MCQTCKARAAKIDQSTITAIDAHRAEIIDVMTQINNRLNAAEMANARALGDPKTPDQDFGMMFAPYVIGFLIGQVKNMNPMAADSCIYLLAKGISDGAAIIGAREVH